MYLKILLLTDIHGNLPALEAALRHPAAQGADRVVSTGDHTGFGPCPRQVTERLMALNADILAGNHEERLPQADDPAFAGYNWELLRWTRAQMEGLPLTWPRTLQTGDMLFAHGTPENPNELLEAEEVPALLARLPEGVRWYFSGHNHNAWNVCAHGCRAVNPGSLGLMEDGVGGRAPFAVIETGGKETRVTRMMVPYDLEEVKRAYVTGGAAEAAPEMCRIALYTMETGTYQAALQFVRLAKQLGEKQGISLADPRAFRMAAEAWDWGDGLSCAEYWRQVARGV